MITNLRNPRFLWGRPAWLTSAAVVAMVCAGCADDSKADFEAERYSAEWSDHNKTYDSDSGSDFGYSDSSDEPLLDLGDFDFGYSEHADPDEEDDLTRAGCLASVDELGVTARGRAEDTFTTDNPFDSPVIKHTVLHFADSAAAGKALKEWEDTMSACDTVEYQQIDSVLDLAVSTDTTRYAAGAGAEVNVLAAGEVDSRHLDINVNQWASAVQVRGHLSVVQVLDFNQDDAVDEGRRLTAVAGDRLAAWAGQ